MGADDRTVSLIVRSEAHVDEAYTANGFVSKRAALEVKPAVAKRLLAVHPYLTTQAGATDGN